MSRPVHDREIEDVLSSIRRLVTQGERGPVVRPAPEGADRLVLTAAHRVGSDESGEGGDAPGDAPLDLTAFRARRAEEGRETAPPPPGPMPVPEAANGDRADTDDMDGEDGSSEVEALLARLSGGAAGTDAGGPAKAPATGDEAGPLPGIALALAGLAERDAAAEPEPGATTPRDADGRSHRAALESTIAELEAAVTDEDSFEPDGSERRPVMDWAEAEASPASFFTSRLRRDDSPDAAVPPEAEAPMAVDVPEEAPSATAAAVTPGPWPQPDTPDPETAGHEPADEGTTLVQPEATAVPVEDEPGVDPVTGPDDDSDGLSGAVWPPEADAGAIAPVPDDVTETPAPGSVVLPDDAVLRRLVAEVLREELAGELGSRITGNVRRLVRREVQRALSGGGSVD